MHQCWPSSLTHIRVVRGQWASAFQLILELFQQCNNAPGSGFSLCYTHTHPSVAYTRQWTGSALIQVMARRQFGAEPLPEPMLASPGNKFQCNLNGNSIIFIQQKCILKSIIGSERNQKFNFSFVHILFTWTKVQYFNRCVMFSIYIWFYNLIIITMSTSDVTSDLK